MSESGEGSELTIWTGATRAAMTGRVLDLLGSAVRPIGVGGPRCAEVDRLAADLDCPCEDDLRKLLIDRPSAMVFVSTAGRISDDDMAVALGQGSTLLLIEPVAADFDQLASRSDLVAQTVSHGRTTLPIVRIPRFTAGIGWRSAADPAEALGRVRSMAMTSVGRADEASLFARLFDAWSTILTRADLPNQIDASLTGPLADVPDDPHAMTGCLTAHGRLADGRGVVVQVSDLAGHTAARLQAVGEHAVLEVTDLGYSLHDLEGALIDKHATDRWEADFTQMVADQWQQAIERPAAAGPDLFSAHAQTLACCLACLLSSRTGEAESPAKLLGLHSAG